VSGLNQPVTAGEDKALPLQRFIAYFPPLKSSFPLLFVFACR
jgi:hypothetical protein